MGIREAARGVDVLLRAAKHEWWRKFSVTDDEYSTKLTDSEYSVQ
jgi:hypothetical protein